jgi:hypothetical protein
LKHPQPIVINRFIKLKEDVSRGARIDIGDANALNPEIKLYFTSQRTKIKSE